MSEKKRSVKAFTDTQLLCGCTVKKYAELKVDRYTHSASSGSVPVKCPLCGAVSKVRKHSVRTA